MSLLFTSLGNRLRSTLVLALLCLATSGWTQDAANQAPPATVDSLANATPTAAPESAESVADSLEQEAPVDTLPELTEALLLLDQMSAAMDSLLVFEQRVYSSTEEERQMLRVQAEKEVKTVQDAPGQLLKLIDKLEGTGAPIDSMRALFSEFMVEKMLIYERSFEYWTDELNELRAQRGGSPSEELGDLELRIETTRGNLDGVYIGVLATLEVADSLKIDTKEAWADTDRILLTNAQNLVGRMQIAVAQRNKLAQRVKDEEGAGAPESEIGNDRIQLRYAERRVRGIAKSLDVAVQLLDKRGVDTTDYRRQSIRATGEVTKDVLNPRVLAGLIRDFAEGIWNWLKDNLPTLLVRVLILVGFVVLFRFVFRLTWWLLKTSRLVRLPALSRALVDGLASPTGSIAGLFIGLWFIGVNAGTMLAGLGVASVIIGLALQDSLSNFAAGFFILVTRPYDVDDIVQTGAASGTVKKMGLANTTIRTFDGRRLLIPNRLIWGNIIENRSAEAARRVEITVRVGYDQDLDLVLQLLRAVVQEDERVLKTPEPEIFVIDLDESWMSVALRPWVRTRDWWALLTQLPRMVRLRFAEEGIEIPYPKTDIAISGNRNPYDPQEPKDKKSKSAPPSSTDQS